MSINFSGRCGGNLFRSSFSFAPSGLYPEFDPIIARSFAPD